MYAKPILAVLVALALAGLATPATAAHVPTWNEYAGGGYVPGVGVGLVLCEGGNKGDSDQPTETGLGGACLLTNLGPTVFVNDDTHGAWDFFVRCGPGPESNTGTGSATNPCPTGDARHLVVFVAVGATTGCTWAGFLGCDKQN